MLSTSKIDKQGDIKSVLESLTVTIESINQRLSGGQGGGIQSTSLKNLSTWLQYLGESLKKVSTSQNELKTLLVDFNSQMHETFKDSIDILAEEINKGGGFQGGPKTPQVIQESFAPKIILDIKKNLADLTDRHSEEIDLLAQQQDFLKEKLISIEKQINQLGKSINKSISKY